MKISPINNITFKNFNYGLNVSKRNEAPVFQTQKDIFFKGTEFNFGYYERKLQELLDIEDENGQIDKILDTVSIALQNDGKEHYQSYLDTLNNVFNRKIEGRLKSVSSIKDKLQDRLDRKHFDSDFSFHQMIPDVCAYRLVFSGSEKETEDILQKIEKGVNDGTLKPYAFFNHGKNPYLDDEQFNRLTDLGFQGVQKPNSNISCVNLQFLDGNRHFELQLIGKEVNKVNIKEHSFYKMNLAENIETKRLLDSDEKISAYKKYIEDCYQFTRLKEIGVETEKPKLPQTLDKSLVLI